MEEILASIRRIIADDQGEPASSDEGADGASGAAAIDAIEFDASPAGSSEDQGADDILDLDDEVASMPAEERPMAAATGVSAADVGASEIRAAPPPPPRLIDEPAPLPPFRAAPGAAPRELPPLTKQDDGRLVSPRTGAAVGGSFNALASTILSQNARTLEDLVEDMMRPMLQEWLDDNLPTIVERLVRTEIERVARGGR